MTLDELELIYDKAKADERNSGKRAGIRAVVEVLRDEFVELGSSPFLKHMTGKDLHEASLSWINEILGSSEVAAGGSSRKDEKAVEADGDKGPVTVNSPAAATVCEWTTIATDALGYAWMNSSCGLVDFHERNIKHTPDGLRCHCCGKPIKFTEAKP